MKLRIQDSSVRYRITLKEMDELLSRRELHRETRIPGPAGAQVFRYSVRVDDGASESRVELEPYGFSLVLGPADLAELAAPENEGAYIRREWTDEGGQVQRFIVFIEKDRPGSTCIKQEAWIYEIDYAAKAVETRPITKKSWV